MSNLVSTRAKRSLATGLATVVGAAALTVMAPSTASAVAAGDLKWKVSDWWGVHFTNTASGGATVNEGGDEVTTFPVKSAVKDVTGRTTIKFAGSTKAAFRAFYDLTISNPTLVIDAAGNGSLTVDTQDSMGGTGAQVQTLTIAGATGSLASGLTIGAESFDSPFVNSFSSALQATFTDPSKTNGVDVFPADAVATATSVSGPAVKTSASVTKKVGNVVSQIRVNGQNFVKPDDLADAAYAGIYLGVAPSGAMPSTSLQADRAKFVGEAPVWKEAITNGSFSALVPIKTALLKPGVSYSVYTWQAHSHVSAALDSETKLGILKPVAPPVVTKAKAKLTLKWAKKSTATKSGKVKVTVAKAPGKAKATGKAKVTIKVKGKKKATTFTIRVKKGAATLKAPKRTQKVTVKYLGDSRYKAATKSIRR